MRERSIGDWLDDLTSESPAPGGGAAAAMNAAIGAALIGMVCNLTSGKPKYAQHDELMRDTLASAVAARDQALRLAEADAAAFDAVMAAYRLPRATEAEADSRRAAIQDALGSAAEVPLRTAALAADVIGLAAAIVDAANRNVVADVAVAASSARAALDAAAINVEVNLGALKDEGVRDGLRKELAAYLIAGELGREVVANVRQGVGG